MIRIQAIAGTRTNKSRETEEAENTQSPEAEQAQIKENEISGNSD